ncbi:MAG: zinc metallopeptidase [Planctomycetes bacterium]|nr:zinc metallopeptidase [Planctomycetota bacterium]
MLASLWSVVSTWWLYVLLTSLPESLMLAVSRAHDVFARWLDASLPDDLPLVTGEWVEREARRLGIREQLEILAAPEGEAANSYRPAARRILLEHRTYYKNDATHWAVGAHELAHAWLHARFPRASPLLHRARSAARGVTAFVPVLLLTNAFYGSTELHWAAMRMLELALALLTLQVLDELLTSTLAARWLRVDGDLSRRQLRRALLLLCGAAATYVAGLASLVLVRLSADWLSRQVLEHTHVSPAAPLSAAGLIACGLCTTLCAYALVALSPGALVREGSLRPDWLDARRLERAGVLAAGAFLWITWDQPLDAAWPFLVTLAVAAQTTIVALVLAPASLLVSALLFGVERLSAALLRPWNSWLPAYESVEESSAHPAARRARRLRERNKRRDASLLRGLVQRAQPARRRQEPGLGRLALSLPMLAYFWFAR